MAIRSNSPITIDDTNNYQTITPTRIYCDTYGCTESYKIGNESCLMIIIKKIYKR